MLPRSGVTRLLRTPTLAGSLGPAEGFSFLQQDREEDPDTLRAT